MMSSCFLAYYESHFQDISVGLQAHTTVIVLFVCILSSNDTIFSYNYKIHQFPLTFIFLYFCIFKRHLQVDLSIDPTDSQFF